jgi:hypothetical protein
MVDQGVIWANWFRDPAVLRKRQQLLAEHYDSSGNGCRSKSCANVCAASAITMGCTSAMRCTCIR